MGAFVMCRRDKMGVNAAKNRLMVVEKEVIVA